MNKSMEDTIKKIVELEKEYNDLKESGTFDEPKYYYFENDFIDEVGKILYRIEEYCDSKKIACSHLKNTVNKLYDEMLYQDYKYRIKRKQKKEYTIKDKINYYSKRKNASNLTPGQRNYAENRIKYLTNLKKY